MQSFWNERFASPEYVYGTLPNAFFAHSLSTLKPGKLLLPADGEGRNAVFAASSGWVVEAFDFSSTARKKALALANTRQVSLSYSVSDIASFPWPHHAFDAVGLFFVHVPEPLRLFLHQKALQALKPDGVILLEAFAPEQLALDSGGPRSADLLYSIDQIKADFSGMEFLVAEQTETILDEGPFHQGRAAATRFFAKKHPAS